MHPAELGRLKHEHAFGVEVYSYGERRTKWVVAITAVMLVVEIAAGWILGSMALLADGWHMGTHAVAIGIAMFAYVFQQYPGLSNSIVLSFPELNGVTRVGSKDELLKLPATGMALLALNLVLGFIAHSWERMVGYVLLVATVCAQGMLLAGAIIALN